MDKQIGCRLRAQSSGGSEAIGWVDAYQDAGELLSTSAGERRRGAPDRRIGGSGNPNPLPQPRGQRRDQALVRVCGRIGADEGEIQHNAMTGDLGSDPETVP